MITAIAHGGPRDGVKLTAALTWDGRIQRPDSTEKVQKHYNGRYKWDWDYNAWIWHGEKIVKPEQAQTPVVPQNAGTPRRAFG